MLITHSLCTQCAAIRPSAETYWQLQPRVRKPLNPLPMAKTTSRLASWSNYAANRPNASAWLRSRRGENKKRSCVPWKRHGNAPYGRKSVNGERTRKRLPLRACVANANGRVPTVVVILSTLIAGHHHRVAHPPNRSMSQHHPAPLRRRETLGPIDRSGGP